MVRQDRIAGSFLVLAGAVLFVVATGGFTSVAADRSANVTVTTDDTAYLGVHDQTDVLSSLLTEGDVIYYMDDNIGTLDTSSNDTVSAEFVRFGDGSDNADLVAWVDVDPDGHDWRIFLECGAEDRNLGEDTITIDIFVSERISIELRRTTTDPVAVDCSP